MRKIIHIKNFPFSENLLRKRKGAQKLNGKDLVRTIPIKKFPLCEKREKRSTKTNVKRKLIRRYERSSPLNFLFREKRSSTTHQSHKLGVT